MATGVNSIGFTRGRYYNGGVQVDWLRGWIEAESAGLLLRF